MATPDMSSRHRLRSLLADEKHGYPTLAAPPLRLVVFVTVVALSWISIYTSPCEPLYGSPPVLTQPSYDVESADHLASLYAATTLEMGRDRPVQPSQG